VEVRVGLEVDDRGHAMAWVAELPGCYARGRTPAAALEKVPLAVYEYCVWLAAHGEAVEEPGEVAVRATERVSVASDLGQALSQGFFTFDQEPWPPEVARVALRAAHHARRDLMELLPRLTDGLKEGLEGAVRTVPETLDHILLMDLWLGLKMLDPDDLETRAYLLGAIRDAVLPLLEETKAGGAAAVVEPARVWDPGPPERWTGQKALRRTIWHDRVHYRQLKRLDERHRVHGIEGTAPA
jgi:predicted RNase H-like HicB family nuclease